MDKVNFNFGNIQCANVQFGNNNIMVNSNPVKTEKPKSYECKGCSAINKIQNEKCEYCGRVKE